MLQVRASRMAPSPRCLPRCPRSGRKTPQQSASSGTRNCCSSLVIRIYDRGLCYHLLRVGVGLYDLLQPICTKVCTTVLTFCHGTYTCVSWRIFLYSYMGFNIPIVSITVSTTTTTPDPSLSDPHPMPRRSRRRLRALRARMGGRVRERERRRAHRGHAPPHGQLREVPHGAHGAQRDREHRAHVLLVLPELPGVHPAPRRHPALHVLTPRHRDVRPFHPPLLAHRY